VAQSHIGQALADESLRVVNTGLRRLAAMATPEATAMLGNFAAGEVKGSWFSQESFNLALSLLLSQGTPGLEALCAALDVMSTTLHPLKARQGRRIAEVIAPQRDDSAKVRASLARWRRSPTRLLGRVLPRIPKQRGAAEE
jgi:hypothetical protein